MFGIGSTEFLVILLVALLVLGPKSLSKISRTVGKYMGEFRRVSTDFQRTLNAEVAEEERKDAREAVRAAFAKMAPNGGWIFSGGVYSMEFMDPRVREINSWIEDEALKLSKEVYK